MPRRCIYNQKRDSHNRARDQIFHIAERVISHRLTEEKKLSDFPSVDDYISSKFPDVDLSPIKLYLSPPRVIEKAGLKDIGGCYIHSLKVILIKNEIQHYYKAKGKFQRLMREACSMRAEVEDVIVHEFIHAVSDLIGRSSARFRHMEEEFVYTNCIDFYHQKGMTDNDIVNNNFLPFCIMDIYDSSKELGGIFAKTNKTLNEIYEMSDGEYQKFSNKNAELIISMIRTKAQEKAHQMIETYHKYGAKMYKTSSTERVEDEVSARFSSLDLD